MYDAFLTQLFYLSMDKAKPPADPWAQTARKELEALEHKWTQTMGQRFIERYQAAEYRANSWQEEAAFLQGLRWGVHLMLSALPYSPSSNTSAP
mgnify:CR=1 FL=1